MLWGGWRQKDSGTRKIQDRDRSDKVYIDQIIWEVRGRVKLSAHFQLKIPTKLWKNEHTLIFSLWKWSSIFIKNYWTNLSFPPTPNKIMWCLKMKVLQSQFSEKNKVSEESRHCPCKNNSTTTTNNSIVEMPFSLEVLTKNIWAILCIRKAQSYKIAGG